MVADVWFIAALTLSRRPVLHREAEGPGTLHMHIRKGTKMRNAGIRTMVIVGGLLALAGCNGGETGVKNTVDNGFVRFLSEAGYTRTPMPSTLESGGSLVFVKTTTGDKQIEWVGDLLACGVPETVVFGADPQTRERLRNGRFPQFTAASSNDFGVALALSFDGVGADADVGGIKRAIITIEDAGHEVIQRLAVASFLSDPATRTTIQPFCTEALEKQKVAVLVDVAYLDKAKVEFYKDFSLKAKLTAPEVIEALKLGLDAQGKVQADGTMVVDERIYVAFKEAFYAPGEGGLPSGSPAPGEEQDEAPDMLQDATPELVAAANPGS
jgi:hypothetical protein